MGHVQRWTPGLAAGLGVNASFHLELKCVPMCLARLTLVPAPLDNFPAVQTALPAAENREVPQSTPRSEDCAVLIPMGLEAS